MAQTSGAAPVGRLTAVFRFREVGVLAALVLLCALTTLVNPKFLTGFNLQILSREIAYTSLMGIGVTFPIITGGIDLSPGSMAVLTGILAAWLMVHGVGVIWAILLVLLVAALIGMWHGFFVTRLSVPPFIITMGTLSIARGLPAVITKGWPILELPESFFIIGQGHVLGVPVPVIIAVIVTALATFVLQYTVIGRHIYAIGGNIEAARLSGINVNSTRMFCYVVSAVLSAGTGIIIASRLSQGSPTVGGGYELIAIASSVIGGTSLMGGEGTVVGALIGTAILSILRNALILVQVSPYWHEVAVGLFVVGAVTVDILRRRGRT